MGLKIRSKRDVVGVALAVAAGCICVNAGVDALTWSLGSAPLRLALGATGTACLALQLTLYFGAQMLTVNSRSRDAEHAARFDTLTGTLTRDAFLRRAKRLGMLPGVLIMVDIDNFKSFNDAHGHLAGDAALRQVAQKLMRCTRANDLVARFGGEEFLVLLPDTGLAEGKRLARELRELLRLTPVVVATGPVTVTASFGVSETRVGEPIEAALSRADTALYRAKRSGRDKVCIAA